MGVLHVRQSEFDRAEEVTIESLEMRKAMLGSDHADVAETLINLANVLFCNGLLALGNSRPLTQAPCDHAHACLIDICCTLSIAAKPISLGFKG